MALILNGQTLIEPKAEMGRPINDQFPYLDAAAYAAGNRFAIDVARNNVPAGGIAKRRGEHRRQNVRKQRV